MVEIPAKGAGDEPEEGDDEDEGDDDLVDPDEVDVDHEREDGEDRAGHPGHAGAALDADHAAAGLGQEEVRRVPVFVFRHEVFFKLLDTEGLAF